MELSGYAFGRVCDVEPDRTDGGAIEVHVPQPDYDRRDEKSVHDYGWGPFCSFGVPDDGTHCPGVYAITVEDEVVYVGETKDLYDQFTDGYGRISPANCFEGGQGTNCRLNTAIFHAAREGDAVALHLHATDDFGGTDEENRALRRIIKDDLVSALNPAWNKASPEQSPDESEETPDPTEPGTAEPTETAAPPNPPEPTASLESTASPESTDSTEPTGASETPPSDAPAGEFAELYDYLAEHERDSVERSFAELEVVLDAPLPTEARRWQRWWTNDESSHPHSTAWLHAGYEVADVSLPEGWVRFERLDDSEPSPRAERSRDARRDPPERPVTSGFRRASPRRRE